MTRFDQERWQLLKSLLNDAMRLPAADRHTFVLDRCSGDDSLRSDLQSLLAHAESADEDGFLQAAAESPVSLVGNPTTVQIALESTTFVHCPVCREPVLVIANSANATTSCDSCANRLRIATELQPLGVKPDLVAASLIDRFQLKSCIGRGGFGTVWQAWDSQLQRDVAIKIPRDCAITPHTGNAFLNEARATAQLRHPNIVSVHDVGSFGETVYVVSDLVEGVPLGDWISRKTITFREIAKLMETISRAIHYSHESGIIHRDLKPGNVMIDASGEPHVMDFGLAKRDAVDVTVSLDGRILGTPAYMSPEQAQGKQPQTDRRADVYSMGVMLYELSTNELPFRGNISTIVHQVIHDPPPSPRKLNQTIPVDLETICLKCMEKSPSQRYDTALELADELARFQRNEPIHARPISAAAQFVRWCQRNPVVATLSCAVAGLLVAGTIAGFVSAKTQANLVAETSAANQRLTDANQELALATERARQKSADANAAVNDFFTEVSESQELLAGSAGTQALRQRLLKRAEEYYSRFVTEDGSQQNEALLADVTGKLASILELLGETENAEKRHLDSLLRYENLLQVNPTSVELQRSVAKTLSNLARVQNSLSKFTEAESNGMRSIEMLTKIRQATGEASDIVSLALVYQVLTNTFHEKGATEQSLKFSDLAFELFETVVQSDPRSPHREDFAATIFNKANGYLSSGDLVNAAASYSNAINYFQALTAESPDNFHLRESLARCHANMAIVEYSNGNLPDATKRFETAVLIYDDLAKDNPRVAEYHQTLAKTRQNLGMMYQAQGMLDEAIQQQRLSIEATQDPEIVAMSLNNLGAIHYNREQYDEAASYFQQMSESLEEVVANSPEDIAAMNKLAVAYNNTASVLKATEARFAEAETFYGKSIALRRDITSKSPLPEYARGLAEAINNFAQLRVKMELFDQAVPLFLESIDIWQTVCDAVDTAEHHASLAETYVNLARCYDANEDFESALQLLRRADQKIDRALELDSKHAGALMVQHTVDEAIESMQAKQAELDTSPAPGKTR
ncbi:MAG: serine/threonine-protein kinase [Pirellulaceae bacterium]